MFFNGLPNFSKHPVSTQMRQFLIRIMEVIEIHEKSVRIFVESSFRLFVFPSLTPCKTGKTILICKCLRNLPGLFGIPRRDCLVVFVPFLPVWTTTFLPFPIKDRLHDAIGFFLLLFLDLRSKFYRLFPVTGFCFDFLWLLT